MKLRTVSAKENKECNGRTRNFFIIIRGKTGEENLKT